MQVIKFNYPKRWDNVGGVFQGMLPNEEGIWEDCQFFINDDSVKACDYWFVCEDHHIYPLESVKCPKENCIFISNEAESNWGYQASYLNQFGRVMTSRVDIEHTGLIQQQHICFWHIKQNYLYLKTASVPQKQEVLSAVISNTFQLEGHQKRYKLMNRLKGHFKDKLHWFGRGEMEIDNKWDGIAPYQYSIAIENSAHERYFTEKIMDCYLSYTMPIYWGCPNILEYFPEDSLVIIEDIDDYQRTIEQIQAAIDQNLYEKHLDAIIEARNLILDKYQIFAFLKDWVAKDQHRDFQRPTKNIIKEKAFFSRKMTWKQQLYYLYKGMQ